MSIAHICPACGQDQTQRTPEDWGCSHCGGHVVRGVYLRAAQYTHYCYLPPVSRIGYLNKVEEERQQFKERWGV